MKFNFVLSASWVGMQVRLLASDEAVRHEASVGFSQPVSATATWNVKEAANLLLRTASHFVLILIPCLTLCAYAIYRGTREVAVIGIVALIGVATPGYFVFWLYFLSPRLGHAVSFMLPIAGFALLVFLLRRIGAPGRSLLRPLLLPSALLFCNAVWILSAGFAYGGMDAPLLTAATRFSHPLPPDNRIPFLFMEGVRSGQVSSPLIGDWLSSDRPPLQTAVAVSQYPYLPQPRDLGYTTLCVLLQSTWLFGLWILLRVFAIDPRAMAVVLGTALFSGFTLVNTFFVWPKLLAATYLLALCAILFTDQLTTRLRTSIFIPLLAGTLLALAFLAHGGGIFAVIGIAVTLLVTRRAIPLKAILLILLTSGTLYLPWMIYQKSYDPPGDRLLKQHLAGAYKVDKLTLLEDLSIAYRKLTFRQWLDARKSNVDMAIDHQREYWINVESLFLALVTGHADTATRVSNDLRGESFFYFAPSLGFLEIGLFGLAAGISKRLRTNTWRLSRLLWTVVACTLAAWCLIMYTPGSTSVHQGAYVTNLLANAAAVLALWAIRPWLACSLGGLQILQSILIYGVFLRESPVHGELLEGTTHYGLTLLFLITFSFSWILLARLAFGQGERPTPTRA